MGGEFNNSGHAVNVELGRRALGPHSNVHVLDHVNSRAGLSRQKTLVRPERQRSQRQAPLLRKVTAAPPTARVGASSAHRLKGVANTDALVNYTTPPPPPSEDSNWWTYISKSMTCLVWPKCMEACGMADKDVQQAWREKVALCMIIGFLCFCVGFFTYGLKPVLCPGGSSSATDAYFNQTDHSSLPYRTGVVAFGSLYDFDQTAQMLLQRAGIQLTADWHGVDISALFTSNPSATCAPYVPISAASCSVANPFPGSPALQPSAGAACPDRTWLTSLGGRRRLFFFWGEVANNKQPPHSLLVFNGGVLNMTTFLQTSAVASGAAASPSLQQTFERGLGRDVTYTFSSLESGRLMMSCLEDQYLVGYVDQTSGGCAVYQTVMIVMMVIIMGVVACRFLMALAFYYFFSGSIKVSKYSPGYRNAGHRSHMPARSDFQLGAADDMYTLLLVTCYSEAADGIRGTLESLAETNYPDDKKLLFVIADGMVKGDDWKTHGKTTPEMIIDMIVQDPALGAPEGKSYLAIADGSKQHNMAKVYAGYFPHQNRQVPIVVVVKCGPPTEERSAKPGNRGKRDSQLILMNFLSRVLFDDRMTPLDHELYTRMCHITGVTPDVYETVLMVDADTVVSSMSLHHMNGAMKADEGIMGLCGETRIANKRESWVTTIQVFEYFISHHLGKAFESVFGGVTCLPGCFCMYRITARKGNTVVPLLVNPDIVDEYSENVVDTLHKKNLLLLGEDRFLTTLMLRSFPKRKMVFVPTAICHTVVPDEFKVLLSQRRRWINSTIHNLLELVLLRDLCGIFCFSMQFVIALELLGTTILPSTLISLYVLIISSGFAPQFLPLILLATTLLLPAVLISLTTRKWNYVGYMFIYLLALPVWNFILPVYAFWRFDDFSWGETRKVVGEDGGDHAQKDGEYLVGSVVLKRFAEWEEDRFEHNDISAYAQQKRASRGRALPVVPNSPFAPPPHRTSFTGQSGSLPPGSYNPLAKSPIPREFRQSVISTRSSQPLLGGKRASSSSYGSYPRDTGGYMEQPGDDAYGADLGAMYAEPEQEAYYDHPVGSFAAAAEGHYSDQYGNTYVPPEQEQHQLSHFPSSSTIGRHQVAHAASSSTMGRPLLANAASSPSLGRHRVAHASSSSSLARHQVTHVLSSSSLGPPRRGTPTEEKKRSWYLETHRRREINSMPAGNIALPGWIDDNDEDAQPTELEPYESHTMVTAEHPATYEIHEVPAGSSNITAHPDSRRAHAAQPTLGSHDPWIPMASFLPAAPSRENSHASLPVNVGYVGPVPHVEIVAATPSERSMSGYGLETSIAADNSRQFNMSRMSATPRRGRALPTASKSSSDAPSVSTSSANSNNTMPFQENRQVFDGQTLPRRMRNPSTDPLSERANRSAAAAPLMERQTSKENGALLQSANASIKKNTERISAAIPRKERLPAVAPTFTVPVNTGPGVRAPSTLPSGTRPRVEESLGIAASKGIASTVRSFWESVGEVPSSADTSRRSRPPRSAGPRPIGVPGQDRNRPADRSSIRDQTFVADDRGSILIDRTNGVDGDRPPAIVLPIHATRGADLLPQRVDDLHDDLSGVLDASFGLDVDPFPRSGGAEDADGWSFSFAESAANGAPTSSYATGDRSRRY